MAVQEPGDRWWDQTSEVAGAVRDDLKRLEFLWFYLVQCVFSLSIRGSPTNHFYLAACGVYCATGCSLPLAYYEVNTLKVRATYERRRSRSCEQVHIPRVCLRATSTP